MALQAANSTTNVRGIDVVGTVIVERNQVRSPTISNLFTNLYEYKDAQIETVMRWAAIVGLEKDVETPGRPKGSTPAW